MKNNFTMDDLKEICDKLNIEIMVRSTNGKPISAGIENFIVKAILMRALLIDLIEINNY